MIGWEELEKQARHSSKMDKHEQNMILTRTIRGFEESDITVPPEEVGERN